MRKNGSFTGKTAVITGGASGIGRALAEELAVQGCEVHIADKQFELAQTVSENINKGGGKSYAVSLDVSDYSQVEQTVEGVLKLSGKIDYFFNNAGIAINGSVSNYTIDDWDYIIDVNFRGVVNGVQAVYSVMEQQGFGHIVNTASLAGLVTMAESVSYCAVKYAVVGLSKSLRASSVAKHNGVKVSALCPGFIQTPMLSGGKFSRDLGSLASAEKIGEFFRKFKPMDAALFAQKALKEIEKNRALIVLPTKDRFPWFFDRLFPSKSIDIAAGFSRKMMQSVLKN